MTRPPILDLAAFPPRQVDRVKAAVHLWGPSWTGQENIDCLLLLDAQSGQFVSLPGTSVEAKPNRVEPLALSRDGIKMAFRSGAPPGNQYLLIYTFADDATQRVVIHGTPEPYYAAFSPTGDALAVMSYEPGPGFDDYIASVAIVGLSSGAYQRLWSDRSLGVADSTITWSPDGRHVAATYLNLADDLSTVVVRLDGDRASVEDRAGMVIIGRSNLSWLGNRELIMFQENWEGNEGPPLVIEDLGTRISRAIPPAASVGCIGAAAGRLVHRRDDDIVTTSDGLSPEVAVRLHSSYSMPFLDVAPGGWGEDFDAFGPCIAGG